MKKYTPKAIGAKKVTGSPLRGYIIVSISIVLAAIIQVASVIGYVEYTKYKVAKSMADSVTKMSKDLNGMWDIPETRTK